MGWKRRGGKRPRRRRRGSAKSSGGPSLEELARTHGVAIGGSQSAGGTAGSKGSRTLSATPTAATAGTASTTGSGPRGRVRGWKKWNSMRCPVPSTPRRAPSPGQPLLFDVTLTPSLNELNEMHWSQEREMRQRYETELLCNYVSPRPWVSWPPGIRRMVKYTRHSPRKLDQTNLVGGMKRLEDALVNVGIMKDDSDRCVLVTYGQTWDGPGDERRTVVEIVLELP